MPSVEFSIFKSRGISLKEQELNFLIQRQIEQHEPPKFFAHLNMHGLHHLRRSPTFRQYCDFCEHIWLDGMIVVWMLKALGHPVTRDHRVTFLDWQHSFFSLASKNKYRVFLLGATESSVGACTDVLQERYPHVHFRSHHGFLEDAESTENVLQSIAEHETDVLLVGMGMPRQEEWILANKDRIQATCTLPVGGYFDYIAGITITPPRWTGQFGLEGAYRLICDPVRLGHRYLIEPWPVFLNFCTELLSSRAR